jgi:type I restriction enzyme S subunit
MDKFENFAARGLNTFGNGPFGSNLLTSEMTHEGIPVIYIADIEEGRYHRETNRHVTPEKARELSGFEVRKGDVILTKVGDPPCDAAPYLEDQRAIMTQDVIRIRPAQNVDVRFLTDLLNSHLGRQAVDGIAVNGTRERVSLTDLRSIQLPRPSYEEQIRIGERIAAQREKMEWERMYRLKLQSLKAGLMQDLLTGRVRVPEAEDRVDEVIA